MNDYINHKWRQFLREPDKFKLDLLREGKAKRSKGKGGVVKAKVVEKSLPLPVPQISEAWGKPGNVDREEAEKLLRRVATGTSWQEKIENLNEFVNSCKGDDKSMCFQQADSTILSKLMALDILAAIVYCNRIQKENKSALKEKVKKQENSSSSSSSCHFLLT